MRKLFKKSAVYFSMIFVLTVLSKNVYAKVQTLWKATNTTYVKSEHPDNFFADDYYGTASVRGADRVNRNGKLFYYNWTQITYDVQGEITRGRANRDLNNDKRQVIKSIHVKDKWNFGKKTRAYYNFDEGMIPLNAYTNYSIEKNVIPNSYTEQNIKGGELLDGVTKIEDGIVLEEGKDILGQ